MRVRGLSFYLISAAAATLSRRLARATFLLFLSLSFQSCNSSFPSPHLLRFVPLTSIYFASLFLVSSLLYIFQFFLSFLSFSPSYFLILFSYVSASFLLSFSLNPIFFSSTSFFLKISLKPCLSTANLFKLP